MTFKIFARLATIGAGLLIVSWLVIVLWAGYELNALPGDGQITLGAEPLPFAIGVRDGSIRSFRIGSGGYLLGSVLALGPLVLGVAGNVWRSRKDERK